MQTWVFAEAIDGAPGALALEMLTKARSFEGDLAAVYVGEPAEEAVATLGAHGATTVYSIDPGDSLPAAGITAALAGLVEEHAPDLILLDINMPVKDGLEALEIIKGERSLRSIPVVIWSTSRDDRHVHKAAELGTCDYVVKPDTFQGLVVSLERVLSKCL